MFTKYVHTNGVGGHNLNTTNSVLTSSHPQGINALLTDGSVRFVSDNMPLTTLQQACVRNDGMARQRLVRRRNHIQGESNGASKSANVQPNQPIST